VSKKDFIIYYNVTGKGHGRAHEKRIMAPTPKEAFEMAVTLIEGEGHDPSTFATFMIRPVQLGMRIYRTQSHGWDGKHVYPKNNDSTT